MATGAVLEDEGYRSFCHFYDPVPGHVHPLNFNLFFVNHVASHDNPDWATGGATGSCSMLGFGDEQQVYSLKSAEQYFYNALTMSDSSSRNENFGDLFLSIGHALHLLEDMAQPQHVRNDMHCDSLKCWPVGLYNPSRYEQYAYLHYQETNANYVPEFDTARAFWAAGDGRGIAEYTNRNFFSAGTLGANNGLNAIYPLPILDGGSTEESVSQVFQEMDRPMPSSIAKACGQPDSCKMKFYSTTGYDWYSHAPVVNQKASTESLFNAELTNLGGHQLYVLNDVNYQEAEMHLFPQIIGYGTGLINFFFRGRLDVKPDSNTEGGYLVINKSSYPMTNGTLTLYYDDVDGNRHPVPDANWSNVSIAEASDDSANGYPIQFSAPTDPKPATSGEYMLVFQGKIGSEDGVAGKLIKVKNQYVYLAADVNYSCLSYSNCYGLINSYNSDFTLHATTIRPNNVFAMAIYDGVEYTLEANYNDVNAGCTYTVMRSGIEFARSPACLNSTPGNSAILDWTIGVNSKYVYLVKSVYSTDAQSYSHYLEEDTDTYDHAGNYVSTIQNLPVQAVGSISVNDTRMCLAGYIDGFVTTAAMLTELSGNPVVTLAEDPGSGIYGGNVYSCTLTKDRAYVLVYPLEGAYTLNVYDLNGNKIASLDVSEAQQPGTYLTFWGVVATNTKIYVPIIIENLNNPNNVITFTYKFIVHDRVITRNAAGAITSENFVREPDVTLPGLHINWGAYPAVDMKDILDSPRQ